ANACRHEDAGRVTATGSLPVAVFVPDITYPITSCPKTISAATVLRPLSLIRRMRRRAVAFARCNRDRRRPPQAPVRPLQGPGPAPRRPGFLPGAGLPRRRHLDRRPHLLAALPPVPDRARQQRRFRPSGR